MDRFSTALVDSVMQQQSTMVINGVPQGGQLVRVYYVKCAACNRVLAQFNPGDPLIGVLNYYKEKLAKDIIYCPTCGAKLGYTAEVIEVTGTEVRGDQNEPKGTDSADK